MTTWTSSAGDELGEVEAVEQRELLQAHRPRRPRQRLADGEAAVLELRDRLERRPPAGQVVAGEEAALGRDEAVDLLGDEALVVRAPRLLDLLLARAAARLFEDAAVRRRQRRVAEERADLGRRQVELARPGPVAQQLLGAVDRRADPGDQREAVLRVADREREHVLEPPGAELLQQQQPAAERARDAGGEDARCRGRARGRARGSARSSPPPGATPWPQSAIGSPRSTGQRSAGTSPPGPFRCGSTTWSVKPGGDRRVEGVAAALEHRHARRGGEPVGRRDHAEGAAQLGPGGEAHWKIRQVVVPCASSFPSASVSFPSAVATREPRWMTIALAADQPRVGGDRADEVRLHLERRVADPPSSVVCTAQPIAESSSVSAMPPCTEPIGL